ncbi:MAG: hypothetical protein H7X99_04080 [Saprospiraceae bacterium]|nr:hypothetical protein [Saprospiraceae bacterium]
MTDNHYYAYYKGELSKVSDTFTEDGIANCTFNNQEMLCYFNDVKKPIKEGKFYYSKCRYGRLIITINPKIKKQIEIGSVIFPVPEGNPGLGNYGCIPTFIKNGKGDIAFNDDNGYKIITLHIARHEMINDINQTILELEPHFFPISDENYIILNNWFRADNNIQGGVNNSSLSLLKVYSGTGTEKGDIPIYTPKLSKSK